MPTPRPGFRSPKLIGARTARFIEAQSDKRLPGVAYPGRDYEGPYLDPALERSLAVLGGMNPYGEPRFRVVWGWKRLTWIGGRFSDGFLGYRMEPKYWPKFERWHLEQWREPDMSPEAWERTTEVYEGFTRFESLGPYPARGEYEQVRCMEDDKRQFFPLVPVAVDQLVRLVDWSRNRTHSEKKAGLEAVEARKEKKFDAMADDMVNDSVLPFHGQRFVSQVPGIPASDGKGFG